MSFLDPDLLMRIDTENREVKRDYGGLQQCGAEQLTGYLRGKLENWRSLITERKKSIQKKEGGEYKNSKDV